MLDFQSLMVAVMEEWHRGKEPVYIWLHPDGIQGSWAIATNPDNHAGWPDMVYRGHISPASCH